MNDVFVDTNVFIADIVEEEERFQESKIFLNRDLDFVTSIINIMEIRTVLSKKKNLERDKIEECLNEVTDSVEVIIPDSSDMMKANGNQRESYAYPFDSIIMATAENAGLEIVSFDSEMIDNGAVRPEKFMQK
ncbi:MAG: type II toxin-antitoxin system VapC family toxin [Candidatus Nanohaloarchaea archaeon]